VNVTQFIVRSGKRTICRFPRTGTLGRRFSGDSAVRTIRNAAPVKERVAWSRKRSGLDVVVAHLDGEIRLFEEIPEHGLKRRFIEARAAQGQFYELENRGAKKGSHQVVPDAHA